MFAIRPAAVAGMFYPADDAALRSQLRDCLEASALPASDVQPKLLIVPHAGYVYSGAVAGRAYAQMAPWASKIRRVVLLGPTHRVRVDGLAVPTVDAFETPLGRICIDRAARDSIAALPQVVRSDRAHAQEHSLEVQLPFLQAVLGDSFELLPLAVGNADPEQVAEVIERLWGGDETLIVISTDLSHYLPYDDARTTDRMTTARMVDLATDFDPFEACGAHALNGAMLAARRHGLHAQLLDLRNSGDTAGDRQRVVGYAALVLTGPLEQEKPADDQQQLGAALLSRARNTISQRLGLQSLEAEPPHPSLGIAGATFVTLRDAAGELRGCIGRLEATAALEDDVRRNAAAAAFDDPRFAPLRAEEWPGIAVEISLLEPAEALPPAPSRDAVLRQLQPHRDGVILEWRGHRSTFLPQVWRQLPQPQDFVSELLRKAGLPADFWAADVQLKTYRVRHYADAGGTLRSLQ
ncbi:AmmeMemoRadiSam system protein B [Piscinibacter sakaiensis]|uniref:AmmeMemoRadiSam system protein B n=1 Tax=Piscinibacter sakaiensis TaxID=1547922 RepID=UPI003AAC9B5C